MNQNGLVMSGFGGFYQVRLEDGSLVECKPRGRLKKSFSKIYPGDNVAISLLPEGKGMVEEIFPRKALLQRPNIANLSKVIIILSWDMPAYDLLLLDRMLIIAKAAGVSPLICFNKIDMMRPEEKPVFNAIKAAYEHAGYDFFAVSIFDNASVLALRQHLQGGISVFAGPSGVGKSSLLNIILAGDFAETGLVSDRLRRGRHTTRYATLLPLGETAEKGFIGDTPGFFTLDIPDSIPRLELPSFYEEFLACGPCRFESCMHHKEPDCTVKEAFSLGKLDNGRYERYLRILEEIESREVKYR